MSYKTRIANVQNVASGQKAIINLPLGPTYDKIIVEMGGGWNASTHIVLVEIKANGRRIFTDTGVNIYYRNAYRGRYTDGNRMVIDFTEPDSRNGANEQLLASIPSAMLKSLTVEVTLMVQTGTPTMNVFAESRGPSNNPFILKRLDFTQSFAQTGVQSLVLPSGASGGIIKRLFLHPSTGASQITSVDLRVNRVSIWETTKDVIELNQRTNRLSPQNTFLCLDFVEDGNLAQALNTERAKEIELRLGLISTMSITGYVDYIDPIGRL